MAPLTEKNNNATKLPLVAKVTKDNVEKPKKRKSDNASTADDKPAKKAKASASGNNSNKAKSDGDLASYDVSGITLPGEDKGNVPIYDTCSDIRVKINNYLKNAPKKIATKAQLLRKFNDCIPDEETVSSRHLGTFLKKNGPVGGANSPVFYPSYVYFEKLRVMQNKPKSKKREEMEKVHGKQGMERVDPSAQNVFMHVSETMSIDKYGKIEMVRMR